jgi:phosphoribosylanthranilate isomerase
MGVEMLGFSIDEGSQAYISPKKFGELKGWISGIQIVAETSMTDPVALLSLLEEYPCEALQVSDPDLLPILNRELDKPLLLRVDVDHYEADELDALMGRYSSEVTYFLLESDQNAELTNEWKDYIKALSQEYPILLGFGLDSQDAVLDAVEELNIKGIALRGGDEIRPGYKDFGAMMDILEALEEDD